jgi:hypothetical protein
MHKQIIALAGILKFHISHPADATIMLESRDVIWFYGTGYEAHLKPKLIQLENGEWFWHQHSPSLAPDGNLLIFNNDNYKAWPFDSISENIPSHATAYRINEEKRSAEQWWTSRVEEKSQNAGWTIFSAERGHNFIDSNRNR